MEIQIFKDKKEASKIAAGVAVNIIDSAIKNKNKATILAPTGMSQVDFIKFLTESDKIDWSKVEMFHLDEYVGIPEDHPASFRNYLQQRFIEKVHPGIVHLIKGDAESLEAEVSQLNNLISDKEIDAAFVGIGENGHLAFNDPPADFQAKDPYLIVELDEVCKMQQVGEGWFKHLDDVPSRAITASIPLIMKSLHIICLVPGSRKAKAVRDCLEGDISPDYPASILQKHKKVHVILDVESSSLLSSRKTVK